MATQSTRLSDLTGSYLLGSIVSVVALSLARVPMWGRAPAASTIVSDGIGTVVYLWRQAGPMWVERAGKQTPAPAPSSAPRIAPVSQLSAM